MIKKAYRVIITFLQILLFIVGILSLLKALNIFDYENISL